MFHAQFLDMSSVAQRLDRSLKGRLLFSPDDFLICTDRESKRATAGGTEAVGPLTSMCLGEGILRCIGEKMVARVSRPDSLAASNLACGGSEGSVTDRFVSAIFALVRIWTGVACHGVFFRQINRAARVLASAGRVPGTNRAIPK